jgi:hypothetical protein
MFLSYISLAALIIFSIQIPLSNSNSIITFANAQNKQDVKMDCIIRGSVEYPPPFLVLRWMTNGECDSTIDYFIPFYNVKEVVPFQGNFLIFLET